jgi:hypothetical protein
MARLLEGKVAVVTGAGAAPAAVFLASPLAVGIAGQVLGVQGGRTFLYRMETTAGADKGPAQRPWTPDEIRAAWDRISA